MKISRGGGTLGAGAAGNQRPVTLGAASPTSSLAPGSREPHRVLPVRSPGPARSPRPRFLDLGCRSRRSPRTEVPGMDLVVARAAGLDGHKATVVATAHTPAGRETRTFGTTTADLQRLATWLREQGVTHVALEATGVSWLLAADLE